MAFWFRIVYPRHTRNLRYLLNLNYRASSVPAKILICLFTKFLFYKLGFSTLLNNTNAVAPFAKGFVFLVSHTVQGKLKECDYQDF